MAIMGPSGSGKTTLMNILGCLDVPDRGPLPARRASTCRTWPTTSCSTCATARSASSSRASTCSPRTTALENVELPLVYAGVRPGERQGARRRPPSSRRPGGPGDAHAHRALRRPAAARRHRPGARHRARDHPRRRAHRQPRHPLGASRCWPSSCGSTRGPHDRAHHPRARRGPAREPHRADRRRAGHRPTGGPADRDWRDTFRTAGEAVRTHRLRSALTMLGILIGISAVVLTVGLGEGAKAQVRDSINSLGTNLLVISPGSTTDSSTGRRGGFGSASSLTRQDAAALASKDARARHPGRGRRVDHERLSLVAGTTNWTTTLAGTARSGSRRSSDSGLRSVAHRRRRDRRRRVASCCSARTPPPNCSHRGPGRSAPSPTTA